MEGRRARRAGGQRSTGGQEGKEGRRAEFQRRAGGQGGQEGKDPPEGRRAGRAGGQNSKGGRRGGQEGGGQNAHVCLEPVLNLVLSIGRHVPWHQFGSVFG